MGCTASRINIETEGFDCVSNVSGQLNLCTKKSGNKLVYLIYDLRSNKLLKNDSLYNSEAYWVGEDLVEFKKYKGIASKSTGRATQFLKYKVSTDAFIKNANSDK